MTSIQSSISDNIPAFPGSTTKADSFAQQFLQLTTSTSDTADSTTKVEISPEAKAVYEKLKTDRDVADKLEKLLTPSAEDDATSAENTNYLSLDDLVEPPSTETGNDGALQEISLADAQKATMREAIASLMVHSVEHRDAEAAQALRAAIDNKTVRIQKAEDVPGVNLKTTVTVTQSPYGKGMTTHKNFNPSPEIRAEIESGHATTMWSKNQGDLYITW